MKIAFAVNDIATEESGYTTTRLALAATNRGHEAWLVGMGDFAYDSDELIYARAVAAPRDNYKSGEAYLNDLRGPKGRRARVTISEFDVLMLRNDPSTDRGGRSWAQTAGINFGRMAMQHGVIVVNDPNGLAKALNKTYFQLFPAEVRPRTIITRDRKEVRSFADEHGGSVVLKPLSGSGGEGVFLLTRDMLPNLNQMVESISRDGYVIAQEYLPAAKDGDTRLFLLNGVPLRHKGKYAAFRRIRSGDDMRSNIHAGGKKAQAEISSTDLRIAEIVRPKLVQDGMFLVGLDIVGDKLMEINVFSPGGLGSAQSFEKVNFAHAVIQALERKVEYMSFYQRNFDNVALATL
jgi:glutathione synthase